MLTLDLLRLILIAAVLAVLAAAFTLQAICRRLVPSKGKSRNSLACLRNAGFYSAESYSTTRRNRNRHF